MALERAWVMGDPCLCVLQGAGCCLAARHFSPAWGLPATLRKGIGKSLALPGPGHLPRGEQVGRRETGQGKRLGSCAQCHLEQRGSRALPRG